MEFTNSWTDLLSGHLLLNAKNDTSDYSKVKFKDYLVSDYLGKRNPKFVDSFEELFVFELNLADTALLSKRESFSFITYLS
jgi:hypothetical protein